MPKRKLKSHQLIWDSLWQVCKFSHNLKLNHKSNTWLSILHHCIHSKRKCNHNFIPWALLHPEGDFHNPLSRRVCTFQMPWINGITLCFFLTFVWPHLWDYPPAMVSWPGSLKQAIFRALSLAPSSCHGAEQSNGCSVTQGAAKFHCCFSSGKRWPCSPELPCVRVGDCSVSVICTCCFCHLPITTGLCWHHRHDECMNLI